VTIPLIASAFTVTHPHIDMALGVVLPLHCYLGFECIITDYLPKRRSPFFNSLAQVSLSVATLGSLYGLYKLNTEDVGITEYVKKIWKN
jgi:succinate dehydrogenase (ubiquinone) membrane anchor subunit